jgi:site-specific DNA recombinase
MKPWLIYTRVSTDEQAAQGCSLDAQQVSCTAIATGHGYTIAEVIADERSGKNLDRPGIQRVLAAVQAGTIGGVLIYKLDRLTRSRRDLDDLLPMFDAAGVALVSVTERLDTSSAMGRFFIAMLGAMAQWERETIAERVTMGIRHRKAQGGFVGGRPPAGLRVVGEKGKRVLELDPVHGPAVQAAWPRVLAGGSLSQLAAYLNSSGVPTSHGTRWTANGARKLILNPRCVGLLCSQTAQDAVREALAGRSAPAHRDGVSGSILRMADRVWLLSGIGRCPLCGERLVGVSANNGSGRTFFYYRCSKRRRFTAKACAFKDHRAELCEGAVVRAVMASIEREGHLAQALADYAAACRKEAGPLAERHRGLVMARDKIGAELSNLAEVAALGGAVAAGLARSIAERQERFAAAEREAAAVEGALAATTMSAQDAESLAELHRTKLATLPELPPEDQAVLLRETLESAVIVPPGPGKQSGEVRLSLHLPRSTAALGEFVPRGPMVERGTSRTNGPAWVVSVQWGPHAG